MLLVLLTTYSPRPGHKPGPTTVEIKPQWDPHHFFFFFFLSLTPPATPRQPQRGKTRLTCPKGCSPRGTAGSIGLRPSSVAACRHHPEGRGAPSVAHPLRQRTPPGRGRLPRGSEAPPSPRRVHRGREQPRSSCLAPSPGLGESRNRSAPGLGAPPVVMLVHPSVFPCTREEGVGWGGGGAGSRETPPVN